MTTTHIIQAIRANIKLGWDQEGNWAPPLVYLLFALIAPVAGVLMLVFMYLVILGESREVGFLAFFLSGAAVFMYVRLVLQGACFAVVEDREHYRMLRYMYIAPIPFPVQILGRIMVKLVIGTAGVLVTFLAGSFILDVPFRPDGIDWIGVAGGLFIGLFGTMAIGWMLSSMMLLVDRMGWIWAEGINGMLFLLSGAVIPLKVLPAAFGWMGELLPISYWSELWRHSLYGPNTVLALPDLTIGQIWQGLWITTVIWGILAVIWYIICDRLARKWARIERETFY